MPKMTFTVSYEEEEFGKGEISCYSREVDDLDPYDFLWFVVKQAELAGYDFKDLQAFTSDGKVYRTEP